MANKEPPYTYQKEINANRDYVLDCSTKLPATVDDQLAVRFVLPHSPAMQLDFVNTSIEMAFM